MMVGGGCMVHVEQLGRVAVLLHESDKESRETRELTQYRLFCPFHFLYYEYYVVCR